MSRVFGRATIAADPVLGNFGKIKANTRMTAYTAGTAAGGALSAFFGEIQLCDTFAPIEVAAGRGPDLNNIPVFDAVALSDGDLNIVYSAFGTAQDFVLILDP